MDALLNSKFLTGSNSERVKLCLLHGHAIPSTRVSDGIFSASVSMRTYSTVDGYDGDLYPRRDSVLNDTNPLSQHESNLSSPKQELPSSQSSSFILQSPQKYNSTSLNEDEEENSLDPYLVKDEPTEFQKISFDFNISTEWRRTYDRISRVFGGLNTKSTTTGTGTSEDEIITSLSVLSPTTTTTTTGNSKISLTGMVLLVSVTSCFAGYAYYTTKKMKR